MNYLHELRAFKDWCLMNQPATGGIALWHALMLTANASGWQEWFTVPSQTLELLTGLSRGGVHKARQSLIDKGLIEYRSSDNRKKASKYKINSLSQIMYSRVNEPVNELVHTSQKKESRVNELVYESGSELVHTPEANQGTSSEAINKLNKTKRNETKNIYTGTPKADTGKMQVSEFVFLTQAEHERLIAEFGEADTLRMIEILDNYIGQNPEKNNRYSDHNRVIRGWVNARLLEDKAKSKNRKAVNLDDTVSRFKREDYTG